MKQRIKDALIAARAAEVNAEKLRNDVWDIIYEEYDEDFIQNLIDDTSIEEYMRGVMSVGGMVIDAPGTPEWADIEKLFK